MSDDNIRPEDVVQAYSRVIGAASNVLALMRRMQMVLRAGAVEVEALHEAIGQVQRLEREAAERGLQRSGPT